MKYDYINPNHIINKIINDIIFIKKIFFYIEEL